MKNRDYKIFRPDTYHHVYNRGNDKMDIFNNQEDFLNFLKRLRLVLGLEQGSSLRIQPLPKNSFSIICYCLMPNHFHFLIRQNTKIPISNLISKLCTSYSMYFNKKYDRIGGLFQDQFKSILVEDDQYLLWLSAYIHQNPAIAGLVQNLNDYSYSSYTDYVNLKENPLVDKNLLLGMVENYEKFVLESFNKIKSQKNMQYLILE